MVAGVHLEWVSQMVLFPGKGGVSQVVLLAGKGGVSQIILDLWLLEHGPQDGSLGAWMLWAFLGGRVHSLGDLGVLTLSLTPRLTSSLWWLMA